MSGHYILAQPTMETTIRIGNRSWPAIYVESQGSYMCRTDAAILIRVVIMVIRLVITMMIEVKRLYSRPISQGG